MIAVTPGCLLLDDLEVGPAVGGAGAATTSTSAMTSMTVGQSSTDASAMAATTSTSTDASSSTGCLEPPGDPTECAGMAPDGSCANDVSCACADCWHDEAKCPAALCDGDGTCEPSKETCLCCDCTGAAECN